MTSEVNVEGMTHCSSVSALVTAHVKHVLTLVEISGERAACDLLGFFLRECLQGRVISTTLGQKAV